VRDSQVYHIIFTNVLTYLVKFQSLILISMLTAVPEYAAKGFSNSGTEEDATGKTIAQESPLQNLIECVHLVVTETHSGALV
jgi:hypothetical protein